MSEVLAGLRVVEFAQNIAVPYCGRMLAAMGADVVKVEPPEGDSYRHIDPLPAKGEGRAFSAVNVGKRSVTIDLGHADAVAAIDPLVRWADVVLTGMKGPDLKRYHIDYARLSRLNPGLVYLETSAFGRKGPEAEQGGYDLLAQALSGLAFLSARDDGTVPESVKPPYIDHATGMCSTIAVLAAVRHRDRTGQGQRVTSSLLGSALGLELPVITRFEAVDPPLEAEMAARLAKMRAEHVPPREQRLAYERFFQRGGGLHDLYYRNYRTDDSWIAIAAVSPALKTRFHQATGLDDPRTMEWAPGSPEWVDLVRRADALFAGASTAHWEALLRKAKVPCIRHKVPFETIDDPQVRANDMVVELEHPTIGRYTTTNLPFVLEGTPANVSRPSPRLGADTDAVFSAIGLDADALARLRAAGVLG